jgi:nucleotide-binding universal stress UspA family protein
VTLIPVAAGRPGATIRRTGPGPPTRSAPSSAVGEIVVGTDDSDEATAALEFSFGEADVRGARLTALYAWEHPEAGRLDGYHDWVLSVDPVDKGAAVLLSEQVAPWRHKYPEVIVTESPVRGHAGRVRAFASQSTDLIVVGGRRGLAPSMGLGPVTFAMLRHAHCPVAVVPGSIVPWAAAHEDVEIARQTRAALGRPASYVTT